MKCEDYFYDSVSHDGDLETQISEPLNHSETEPIGAKGPAIEEGILNIMDNHAGPAQELDLAKSDQS